MTTDAVQTSKWLTDIYAPLDEEVTAFDLPVEGNIPLELEGRFVRNGPNPLGPVEPGTYHWFTGDGMVHGVRLRNGGAEWYRARWVRSTKVSEALGETPRPASATAGSTPPTPTWWDSAAGRSPSSRPGHGRSSSPTTSTRSSTATSAAHCRTASPPIRRSTRPPGPARHRLPLGDPAPAVHRRRVRRPGPAG